MVDRSPEEIIAELERASRRARPFLIVGLFIVFASLVVSVVYFNILLAEAREETKNFKAALATLKHAAAVAKGPERNNLAMAVEQAIETAAGDSPTQIPLEQLEVRIWTCAGSPSQNQARAAALRRMRPANAARDWPLETLSVELNSRPNYRLVRNEIRYNPDEEEAAGRLQQMTRESRDVDAAKVLTFYPSPRSISVFFCQGGTPRPIPASLTNSTQQLIVCGQRAELGTGRETRLEAGATGRMVAGSMRCMGAGRGGYGDFTVEAGRHYEFFHQDSRTVQLRLRDD